MKTILIIVLATFFLVGVLLLVKDHYVKRKLKKLIEIKYRAIKPIIVKLNANESVTSTEILMMAENPSLRIAVFRILQIYDKSELFPDLYMTYEKAAESFLVNWLEFPTELGKVPDNIELLTKVTLTGVEVLDYYVFKFSAGIPRWMKYGWMIGTCGPYREQSHPYDTPAKIFSRFNVLGSISPESEVQWVHENINK
jgi:hypothetical protein